jgi:hypothetical protein
MDQRARLNGYVLQRISVRLLHNPLLQEGPTYHVRYRDDTPPRTRERRPPPTTETALMAFLGQALGMEPRSVQHLVAEAHRWGSGSMPFDFPAHCARWFVPYDPPAT